MVGRADERADEAVTSMAPYVHSSTAMTYRTIATLVCVGTLSAPLALAAGMGDESGTLQIDRRSAALVVGLNRGDGVLRYGGEDIPISIGGVTFPEIGIVKGSASGKVYDLRDIEDFDGTYAGAGAGLTIAGGGTAVALKNERGVTVVFLSANQGLDADLSTTGVRMEIDRAAWAAQRAEHAARRAENAAGAAESAAGRVESAVDRLGTAEEMATGRNAGRRESPTAGVGASKAE